MRVKIFFCLTLIFFILLVNSCEDKAAMPTVSFPSNCDTTNLTYSSGSNTMKAIIDLQCATNNTSCHSPSGASRSDYSFYSAALLANCQNGSLIGSLFHGNPNKMPLSPQPGWADSSECMLAKFKAWVNQGYKQ
jgi:hypothetical protein